MSLVHGGFLAVLVCASCPPSCSGWPTRVLVWVDLPADTWPPLLAFVADILPLMLHVFFSVDA